MSYAKIEFNIMGSRAVNMTAKIVYTAIVSHRWTDESEIFPSYTRIAKMVGVSRRTAIRAVQQLIDAGFLKKHLQKNGSQTNLYTLTSDNNVTGVKNVTGDKTVTATGDKSVTGTSDKNVTPKYNKGIEKRNTQPDRDPVGAPVPNLEQKNKVHSLTSKMQLLGKGSEWVEIIELYGKAYLRLSSPVSRKYINNTTISTIEKFLKNLGIVLEPKILEHNQFRAEGVIL